MAYVWQRWLARELRAAGLNVVEIEGWQNRGRPSSTGAFDPRGPVTVHHTGATSSQFDNAPGLQTLISGRSDLPGPLAQIATAYDGTIFVIAAGRCNHAGRVGKSGQRGMPYGADGNALALGNEVITNGTQRLSDAQRRSIAIANRVFINHFKASYDLVHRHQDISGTGKWDIGSISTKQLRIDAQENTTTQEDDVSAQDVWDHPIGVIGKDQKLPASQMLNQTHNRTAGARSAARTAVRGTQDLAKLIKALPNTSAELQALADDIVARTAAEVERLDAAAVAEQLEIDVKEGS